MPFGFGSECGATQLGQKADNKLIFGPTVSALVWKVAQSLLWYRKLRHLRLRGESRAVSISVAKVARNCFSIQPSTHWSGTLYHLSVDMESRAVSALVLKVAPSPAWSGKLPRTHTGLAPSFIARAFSPRSGKLPRLHFGLEK